MPRVPGSGKDLKTRNITLPIALDTFICNQVESGRYANISEVIREAVRTLQREEHARMLQLQQTAQQSIEAVEGGQKPMTSDEFRRLNN